MSVITGFPTTGSATLRNLRLVDVVDGRIRTGLAVHVRDGVISAITADDGADARSTPCSTSAAPISRRA